MLIGRLVTRRRMRAMLVQMLKARPGVDPADPALSFTTTARFDAAGITSETVPGSGFVRWATVTEIVRTADAIYLLTGPLTGLFVPRRAMSDAQAQALDALLAFHCEHAA